MKMEGDAEAQEDLAVQQVSVEAGSSSRATPPTMGPGHRRCQSEITIAHRRSNSFQKLKVHVQKAWCRGGNFAEGEQGLSSIFNLEVLANQKRQWNQQLHSKTLDSSKYKDPSLFFEHFIVAGLQSHANLEAVEDAFARRKRWEAEVVTRSEFVDFRMLQHRGPSFPILEPQILFKYPPTKRLPMRAKDLAAFCFPGGVQARLLERTPSLSDLNELVYGQEHLGRDDLAFIFSFKMADNATIYGICLHVSEIVQRPPGLVGNTSPLHSSLGCPFLVAAPRCYCVLARTPFFEFHYEILNGILAQERLNRVTDFINGMALSSHIPSASNVNGCHRDDAYEVDWKAAAIPVHSAVALSAAAAGIVPEDGVKSSETLSASDNTSDLSQSKDFDTKNMQCMDDNTTNNEASKPRFNLSGSLGNRSLSLDVGTFSSSGARCLEIFGSSDSLFSPARGVVLDDEDDELVKNHEKDLGDDVIMEWARENKNYLLQIVCGYHALPIPPRGHEIVYRPLEHLQTVKYRRPLISDLGLGELCMESLEDPEVLAKLAASEEALSLSIWTTATICRVLSLESMLALVAGVLLEKQVVLVCPNLGVLSATTLSIVPMIRPFQWQCLMLPVLPGKLLDFLDAPVPFIVGVQQTPRDLKMKTSDLVQVKVLKDQVKTCNLPPLPRHMELASELRTYHSTLACEHSNARKHPMYRCSELQVEASRRFLNIMRNYLESLCSDLRSHTITSVQSDSDRVSLLLKDSFIDSFPLKDRAFIKLFVDTQMFTTLSDARLSTYESVQL